MTASGLQLNPEWVVLVGAVPLLVWTVIQVAGSRRSDGPALAAAWSRVVVAAAIVAIGLRPTAVDEVEVPVPGTTDVVLLVDRTASMGASDAVGGRSRIEALGDDLAELVIGTGGANVSVIVFDDDARVTVPSTTDATAVATHLRTLGWRPSAKATGSDISVAFDTARDVLEASAASALEHRRFVVYAGDGEQTADAVPASFAPLSELLDGALVLGYGTEDGGPMPIAPGETEQVTLDGEVQRSVIDEENLRAIATDLGGDYLHRTGAGDLPAFAEAEASTATELQPGTEYHWWIALAASGFLLHLLIGAVLELRQVREEL